MLREGALVRSGKGLCIYVWKMNCRYEMYVGLGRGAAHVREVRVLRRNPAIRTVSTVGIQMWVDIYWANKKKERCCSFARLVWSIFPWAV